MPQKPSHLRISAHFVPSDSNIETMLHRWRICWSWTPSVDNNDRKRQSNVWFQAQKVLSYNKLWTFHRPLRSNKLTNSHFYSMSPVVNLYVTSLESPDCSQQPIHLPHIYINTTSAGLNVLSQYTINQRDIQHGAVYTKTFALSCSLLQNFRSNQSHREASVIGAMSVQCLCFEHFSGQSKI